MLLSQDLQLVGNHALERYPEGSPLRDRVFERSAFATCKIQKFLQSHPGIRVTAFLQNIAEILVLELGVIPHASLITRLLVGRAIGPVAVAVSREHIN